MCVMCVWTHTNDVLSESMSVSHSASSHSLLKWEKTLWFSFIAAKYGRDQCFSWRKSTQETHKKETNLKFPVFSEISVFTWCGWTRLKTVVWKPVNRAPRFSHRFHNVWRSSETSRCSNINPETINRYGVFLKFYSALQNIQYMQKNPEVILKRRSLEYVLEGNICFSTSEFHT